MSEVSVTCQHKQKDGNEASRLSVEDLPEAKQLIMSAKKSLMTDEMFLKFVFKPRFVL